MRLLSKVRYAFRIIISAAKNLFAGLSNGTIQIGIVGRRFIYEDHSRNREIKINIPLSPVSAQPALGNA